MPGSKEEYQVLVEKNVWIKMRDGTRLAMDVYRPARDGAAVEGKFPTVMVRSCYNKEYPQLNIDCHFFAKRGYVVVIQDVRGRFRSEGRFYHGLNEAEDGYDTIEWVAKQPYSDGKIGMTGISYLAAVQAAAAVENPPHLTSIFHVEAPANYYDSGIYEGGVFLEPIMPVTFFFAATGKDADADPVIKAALLQQNAVDWLGRLPLIKGRSPLKLTPEYEDWIFDLLEHPAYGKFWKEKKLWVPEEYLEDYADAYGCYISGWYDQYPLGATKFYTTLSRTRKRPQRLVLGPWLHARFSQHSGDVDFGPDAGIDAAAYSEWMLEWFDFSLKGLDTKTGRQKPVRVFVMGGGDGRKNMEGRMKHGGRWIEEDDWPLSRTEYTKYFLHGDGALSTSKPGTTTTKKKEKPSSSYAFDPKDPVPSIGGTFSFSELIRLPGSENLQITDRLRQVLPVGAQDQRERRELFNCKNDLALESRRDILIYQTPPLLEEVEVVGPLMMKLWASSSAVDTDFTAKLIDVHPPNVDYPEGYAMNLSDGAIRARYRDSFEKPSFMTPGKVYGFDVTFHPIGNLFTKGHRIRLAITSSNFPAYDVNPNTGALADSNGKTVVAENTVYHDARHPSHIVLPVLPRRGRKKTA